jgi:ubiquinone/menaquinone biosynthesis C-methylase UbiE
MPPRPENGSYRRLLREDSDRRGPPGMDDHLQKSGFASVDRASEPETLVDYLNVVSSLDGVRSYKRQAFTLLELREGDYVLDVGCGTGDDLRALAALVGPNGEIVGVDGSAQMIAAARQRTAGMREVIRLWVGDAQCLPFADQSFDACRVDRVLQHLDNPTRALAEMVRVARPGARLVASEPDWGTLAVDLPTDTVTRRLLELHDRRLAQPWIGRHLPALFHELGLANVVVVPQTVILDRLDVADPVLRLRDTAQQACETGIVTADEAAKWVACLQDADRAGRFFAACTLFTVKGSKRRTAE